jgi:ABC-type glutathione transport system ATPase component
MNKRPPLLEVRDLHVSFPIKGGVLGRVRSRLRAVDGVSISIAPGEALGLVGESGCGKTTLARAVMGLEKPQSGQILLDGQSLHGADTTTRRRVQMVFQDPYSSLNPRLTVRELITEAALVHGLVTKDNRDERARELLSDVGLPSDILHRYPHAFSGGQRQRLSIARALSLEPSLMVCDEPVSALDVSVQAQVINLLMDLQKSKRLALLFISHDLSVVQHLAQRIAVMFSGRIVEMGLSEQVMDAPQHSYTKTLLAAVPHITAS